LVSSLGSRGRSRGFAYPTSFVTDAAMAYAVAAAGGRRRRATRLFFRARSAAWRALAAAAKASAAGPPPKGEPVMCASLCFVCVGFRSQLLFAAPSLSFTNASLFAASSRKTAPGVRGTTRSLASKSFLRRRSSSSASEGLASARAPRSSGISITSSSSSSLSDASRSIPYREKCATLNVHAPFVGSYDTNVDPFFL
jgi:hypothetical protein